MIDIIENQSAVMVALWSEKRSFFAHRNLHSDWNHKFVSTENVNFVHRKGILLTFYIVTYFKNNLIQETEPKKPLS